jgi:hypothetical protein
LKSNIMNLTVSRGNHQVAARYQISNVVSESINQIKEIDTHTLGVNKIISTISSK